MRMLQSPEVLGLPVSWASTGPVGRTGNRLPGSFLVERNGITLPEACVPYISVHTGPLWLELASGNFKVERRLYPDRSTQTVSSDILFFNCGAQGVMSTMAQERRAAGQKPMSLSL